VFDLTDKITDEEVKVVSEESERCMEKCLLSLRAVIPKEDPLTEIELAVEKHFGKFKNKPRFIFADWYDNCGSHASCLIKGGQPIAIVLDKDLSLDLTPRTLAHAFTHEMLEWRFNELGEEKTHKLAQKHTCEVLHPILKENPMTPFPLLNVIRERLLLLRKRFLEIRGE